MMLSIRARPAKPVLLFITIFWNTQTKVKPFSTSITLNHFTRKGLGHLTITVYMKKVLMVTFSLPCRRTGNGKRHPCTRH